MRLFEKLSYVWWALVIPGEYRHLGVRGAWRLASEIADFKHRQSPCRECGSMVMESVGSDHELCQECWEAFCADEWHKIGQL